MPRIADIFHVEPHVVTVPSEELPLPSAKVGIEVEVENLSIRAASEVASKLAKWSAHEDHSLRGGSEFVTRGGMVGADIRKSLELLIPILSKVGASVGYPRAGIHLHVDCTELCEKNKHELLGVVKTYLLFEEAMFRWAGAWRAACGFCDPYYLSKADLQPMSMLLKDPTEASSRNIELLSKYHGLNLIPLARFGTIEFRQLPTTFDVSRIMTWIKLVLSIKKFGSEVVEVEDYLAERGFLATAKDCFGETADAEFMKALHETDTRRAVESLHAMCFLTEDRKPAKRAWSKELSATLLNKYGVVH